MCGQIRLALVEVRRRTPLVGLRGTPEGRSTGTLYVRLMLALLLLLLLLPPSPAPVCPPPPPHQRQSAPPPPPGPPKAGEGEGALKGIRSFAPTGPTRCWAHPSHSCEERKGSGERGLSGTCTTLPHI